MHAVFSESWPKELAQHVENGNQLVSPVWEQWGGQGIGAHTADMKPGTTLRQAPKQGLNLTSVLHHTIFFF